MPSKMRIAGFAFVAASMMFGLAGTASATTIATGSTINFAGQSTCSATSCTFGNVIVTSGTGSFSGFTFGTLATFLPLAVAPYVTQQIYTSTNTLGQTASFFTSSRLDESSKTVGTLTSYLINDAGTIYLTGFDSTPGAFVFSANQNGTMLGSFSATAATLVSAAPEPATWAMMIFGFGLAGLRLRSARRSRGNLVRI
jgi:hypothetical protein